MDVVDAGTHLRFKMMRHQAVQNRKFGTGRLKGNHIGVHCVDFRDNVLKLAVEHMGVNLRFRFYLCVAETECLDRKVQIVAMPVGAAERQLFQERGFVNLNNTDACSFQFQNLFPDCKADLIHHLLRGNIFSGERPVQNRDWSCQHSLHILIRQGIGITDIIGSNGLLAFDVPEHNRRLYAPCTVRLYPTAYGKHITRQIFAKKFHHVVAFKFAMHQDIQTNVFL